MQRKRTGKDVYVNHVDFGSSAIPMAKMRKFAMTKLIKLCVLVIIGYIIYSVYRKNSMVQSPDLDSMSIYDNVPVVEKNIDRGNDERRIVKDPEIHERRVKAEINKVFEEFKRKQDEKQKVQEPVKDLVEDRLDDANRADDDRDKLVEKQAIIEDVGDIFENDGNLDIKEDKDDIMEEFEEFNVEEEKNEREIEKDIEQQIAEVLGDAKKEAEEADKQKIEDTAKELEKERLAPIDPKLKDRPQNIEIQRIVEQLEFNAALDKNGYRRIQGDARREALRNDNDHEFPPLVTAVRQTTLIQIRQLIVSIHHHLPGRKLHIYSLDLTDDQKRELIAACGVRLKHFIIALFPEHIRNLDTNQWKPLVMQAALAEFGHMAWINPGFVLSSSELAPIVHESHETGIVVMGTTVSYTTFAATHPDMYKFISTDQEKLAKEPHVEIRAIMIHNTKEIHENIMKVFTACAFESSCLAPPGAKRTCKFDFTGRKHADCHRYDESALNILLKNYFNFNTLQFTRRNNYFRPYNKEYNPKLKQCRKISDIRNNEL